MMGLGDTLRIGFNNTSKWSQAAMTNENPYSAEIQVDVLRNVVNMLHVMNKLQWVAIKLQVEVMRRQSLSVPQEIIREMDEISKRLAAD